MLYLIVGVNHNREGVIPQRVRDREKEIDALLWYINSGPDYSVIESKLYKGEILLIALSRKAGRLN